MKIIIIMLTLLSLSACSTQLEHYEGSKPAIELETFFKGNLKAYGLVMDWKGKVIRRFSVDMKASWEKNVGTLEEEFYYKDGERQQRIWTLTKTGNNTYVGSASDVLNQAQGRTKGYAFNWHYTLHIPIDGESWTIDFNDWMYLIDEKRLLNKAEMKKWGFKVGEVLLWIEKIE